MPFLSINKPRSIQLRYADECQHIMCNGDTGTGKSTLLRQLMHYAADCGDAAIVLDSKVEFVPEFYDERRGDFILSPKDERCPWWSIGDEVSDETDAISVTRALYPSHNNNPQAEWFETQATRISAYLLTYSQPRPTCADFGYWMAHPEEIDRRIEGSEYEHTLSKNSAPQRNGVLATLNLAGMSLRMMPAKRRGRRPFHVRNWCKQRQGWLFLPNTQDTREALRPLQSMWIDLLLLRLMSMGPRPDLPRVWIFLDELASLNTLPSLHTAITEMRSTGNPIVMAMQNLADLEMLYGKKSETIFSQTYTKFVLRTSDGRSAESLSKLAGDVELLRLRETHSHGPSVRGRNASFSTETVREPRVLPSQIGALQNLEGLLFQPGVVVPFHMHRLPVFQRAPRLIERTIPSMYQRPPAKSGETPPSQMPAQGALPLTTESAATTTGAAPEGQGTASKKVLRKKPAAAANSMESDQ
ncbi:MAG TPA: type IV secretion system DNA-binding domain-containing protein [Edaphobacter sp.]|nr:type IV secretion system DNA-binding domain-containing protein [Edaphobacter sp.]